MKPLKKPALVGAVLLLGLSAGSAPMALIGCGDDTAQGGTASGGEAHAPPPNPAATHAADAGADATGPSPTANMPALPTKEFQESDFAETDRSRDPFRTFSEVFVAQAKGRATTQHLVLIDRYALDEMKLMGIVTRGPARALLTDPTGLGWVAKVGDFVGKSELVHSGGPTGVDIAVNWRIDRIRDEDVVFIREDASHPEIPPTTRVISLHPPETGTQ